MRGVLILFRLFFSIIAGRLLGLLSFSCLSESKQIIFSSKGTFLFMPVAYMLYVCD